jgi:uncharacterized protein with PIN domain
MRRRTARSSGCSQRGSIAARTSSSGVSTSGIGSPLPVCTAIPFATRRRRPRFSGGWSSCSSPRSCAARMSPRVSARARLGSAKRLVRGTRDPSAACNSSSRRRSSRGPRGASPPTSSRSGAGRGARAAGQAAGRRAAVRRPRWRTLLALRSLSGPRRRGRRHCVRRRRHVRGAARVRLQRVRARSRIAGLFSATLGAGALVASLAAVVATRPVLVRLLEDVDATCTSFDECRWSVAVRAVARYGKGRHQAALNLGDCLTDAVARVANEPLLCLDDDFAHTDLDLVCRPRRTRAPCCCRGRTP